MKYLLAGLGIVAAVAALFFRPPLADPVGGPRAAAVPTGTASADNAASVFATAQNAGPGDRSPWPAMRSRTAAPEAASRVVVYVAGEVLKPGVYNLATGARAQDALARAGGPKPDADLVAVNLAARVQDGAEIAVPKLGEATPRTRRSSPARKHAEPPPRGHARGRQPALVPAPQSVDLNSADAGELTTLPRIGPALAARIIAYRKLNGRFASVDELADVSGITPRLQDKLADFVIIR